MSPNSRRFLMILLVALSYFVLRFIEFQIKSVDSELPHNRHNEWEELQDDLYHLADSCSLENVLEDETPRYLKISCLVNDQPEGYKRRLKPVDYGRHFFLNQRIPKSPKRRWNFRVPVDSVKGNGLSSLT
ncbi:uncharacterized protein Dana_GF10263 [Drosophila ananassae]|uniref:Uncharacterized protein n=1 Tax=Drosophila ananassae TaxID=7217 RepID=B3M819_DROAN|nr:uncharacterized protein LOC6493136 [Drosophila ananassae]EDV39927.1 uncharacterized protein Dana_GF10263 [Drosophila ananassae]